MPVPAEISDANSGASWAKYLSFAKNLGQKITFEPAGFLARLAVVRINKIWLGIFLIASLMVVWAVYIFLQNLEGAGDRHTQAAVVGSNDLTAAFKVVKSAPNDSPGNHAGHDSTVENSHVSEADLLQSLKEKSAELSSLYPLGYALLGVAGGNIVYLPNFQKMSLNGDWKNAKFNFDASKQLLTIVLPKIKYVSGNGAIGMMDSMVFSFQYQPNRQQLLPVVFDGKYKICTEVIDVDKGILLLGFRKKE